MVGNNKRLLLWPRKRRPIPLDALPGAEHANMIVEMAREAHAEEVRTVSHELRITKRVLGIIMLAMIFLGAAGAFWYNEMQSQLNAPERILKEKEAQRWIIMGPTEAVLSEPGGR